MLETIARRREEHRKMTNRETTDSAAAETASAPESALPKKGQPVVASDSDESDDSDDDDEGFKVVETGLKNSHPSPRANDERPRVSERGNVGALKNAGTPKSPTTLPNENEKETQINRAFGLFRVWKRHRAESLTEHETGRRESLRGAALDAFERDTKAQWEAAGPLVRDAFIAEAAALEDSEPTIGNDDQASQDALPPLNDAGRPNGYRSRTRTEWTSKAFTTENKNIPRRPRFPRSVPERGTNRYARRRFPFPSRRVWSSEGWTPKALRDSCLLRSRFWGRWRAAS
jgi:uncharacterized protein YnzC (UPF0291/DUF896 family)